MDTKWLEDFVVLAEEGSFTKAAEKRYVTQPAFSRRIRSLESWLGVELMDRNTYPARLTAIGKESVEPIKELLSHIIDLKANTQARQVRSHAVVLSTQASLSVSFCPAWFSSIQPLLGDGNIRVVAGNLYDSLDQFLAGQSDMLLCYDIDQITPSLNRVDLRQMQLGEDRLLPVCKYGIETSLCSQDSSGNKVFQAVNYPSESFFGQLIHKHCIPKIKCNKVSFHTVFETALSESVYAHVLAGAGIAWLPESLVKNDLEIKRLMHITNLPSVEMKIIFLTQEANRCSSVINSIWQFMQKKYLAQ